MEPDTAPPSIRLRAPPWDEFLCRDRGAFHRRWRVLRETPGAESSAAWLRLREEMARSLQERASRAARIPPVRFDASLPIHEKMPEIITHLRERQVLVVAGETGSGKTTQLPLACLAAGLGTRGLIGCTQPRRIAARAVAGRIAQELASPLGELVGYQVRFTEKYGERTLIKLMTDGILLAETQADRWLSRYEAIIVDEAHERSLNIDFLLGYLQGLLQRRKDLKVIVTSATIDTERFAAHFGGAPVVNVEGRTHPVQVRWRPVGGRDAAERVQDAIVQALDEVTAEDPRGDVLVFLPGEREIRDLHRLLEGRNYRATEILPLYARLPNALQDRLFQPGPARRVVLATNVAETSLTVPRIRYVIDPGLARVNRFSVRHKVQRLQVEAISQASADQRKGRCGRVGPGVCYRLYGEEDYAQRARYTDPELLRSSLANVILRLMSLKLGPIDTFPFLDPPSERASSEGYQQLLELNAITADRQRLTAIGQQMAAWPVDAKLSRMLVEARRLGALRETIVIAAFLSIQDPRERPAEQREQADAAHRAFQDADSDFSGLLKLWSAYAQAHAELTGSQLRQWCERRFLSFVRMREWRELHRQLHLLVLQQGWSENAADASYECIHRALLSGLPSQVAQREEKNRFIGTRGRRYVPFPGSGVAAKPPAWMLSATLLETQKLYALTNAKVLPEWILQQCAHLCKHAYYDPHWSAAQGWVSGYVRISLHGLVLVEGRRIHYGSVDPVVARSIFLRDGVLTGNIRCRAAFVRKNQEVLAQAREEQARRRQADWVRGENELLAWLDARVPATVCTASALDRWYAQLDAEQRESLCWTLSDVMNGQSAGVDDFPAALAIGAHAFGLHYRFEPGHPEDGVTLEVPLALLGVMDARRLQWLVPGLLHEKVTAMIRALPKALRRNFVPAPEFARSFVEDHAARRLRGERADLGQWPELPGALRAHFKRVTGIDVPEAEWRDDALPEHLRFLICVLDADGATLEQSRDLQALKQKYAEPARLALSQQFAADLAREGVVRWDFEELPQQVRTATGVAVFPALCAMAGSAAIRMYADAQEAHQAHATGVLWLLQHALEQKKNGLRKNLALPPQWALARAPVESLEAMRGQVLNAAVNDLAGRVAPGVRTRHAFEALVQETSKALGPAAQRRFAEVARALEIHAVVVSLLRQGRAAPHSISDARTQLHDLLPLGFAGQYPLERLTHVVRYLRALQLRMERVAQDPPRDLKRLQDLAPYLEAYQTLSKRASTPRHGSTGVPHALREKLEALRWQIEEYRVQLFAQELKTAEPVSDKRLKQRIQEIETLLGN